MKTWLFRSTLKLAAHLHCITAFLNIILLTIFTARFILFQLQPLSKDKFYLCCEAVQNKCKITASKNKQTF